MAEPLGFVGIKYMRADGAAWGGFAACREGDVGAFPVIAVSEAAAVCDDQEEPAWYGYENPNTFDDGKRACVSALRALAGKKGAGQ